MTRQTCCGNIEAGKRPWPEGPSETRGAPKRTKNCYKDFEYTECDECCDDGGDCSPSNIGGYCDLNNEPYIYENGTKQETDKADHTNSNRSLNMKTHHERELENFLDTINRENRIFGIRYNPVKQCEDGDKLFYAGLLSGILGGFIIVGLVLLFYRIIQDYRKRKK